MGREGKSFKLVIKFGLTAGANYSEQLWFNLYPSWSEKTMKTGAKLNSSIRQRLSAVKQNDTVKGKSS